MHHIAELDHLELDERSSFFNIMFLNGEYWGVYDTRQKADDADYTDYYYDQNEYEMDYIKCWGGTWAEYGTMAPWGPFVTFVTTNDMTIAANYDYVTDNFNTLSLIDYILVNTFSVCTDWLNSVSYTHLRAHETVLDLVCRLLLEKKKKIHHIINNLIL